MKSSEARALIALLQAYYPGAGRELPDSTVQLWTAALESYDIGDGTEAVHELASHSSFLPALADIEKSIREIRDARELRDRKALPPVSGGEFCSFEEFLRAHPDMRDRVRATGLFKAVLERAETPLSAAEGGS